MILIDSIIRLSYLVLDVQILLLRLLNRETSYHEILFDQASVKICIGNVENLYRLKFLSIKHRAYSKSVLI